MLEWFENGINNLFNFMAEKDTLRFTNRLNMEACKLTKMWPKQQQNISSKLMHNSLL